MKGVPSTAKQRLSVSMSPTTSTVCMDTQLTWPVAQKEELSQNNSMEESAGFMGNTFMKIVEQKSVTLKPQHTHTSPLPTHTCAHTTHTPPTHTHTHAHAADNDHCMYLQNFVSRLDNRCRWSPWLHLGDEDALWTHATSQVKASRASLSGSCVVCVCLHVQVYPCVCFNLSRYRSQMWWTNLQRDRV